MGGLAAGFRPFRQDFCHHLRIAELVAGDGVGGQFQNLEPNTAKRSCSSYVLAGIGPLHFGLVSVVWPHTAVVRDDSWDQSHSEGVGGACLP